MPSFPSCLMPRFPYPNLLSRSVLAICGLWFIGGAYVDGWAHNHIPKLETFFTPWHGILYSGFAVTAAALLAIVVWNRKPGERWKHAIPTGYGPAILGICTFAVAGVLDMLWHIAFGIENGIDALLSPTHLLLGVGAC